jgi:hypothetical protein
MSLQSGQLQLSDIRLLCMQEADMVNSNFISTAEWNSYINQSRFELYDLILQKYGNDYYVQTPYMFTTDGVNQLFALPLDFLKSLLVELQISPGVFVTLKTFNLSEKNKFSIPNTQSFYSQTNLRYRMSGNNIMLAPFPTAGQVLRLWYVPRLPALVVDTDVADGLSGWLEYVIVDAAMKALSKEESDVSIFMARKQGLIQRIEAAAENRDIGNPMTVSDNSSGRDWNSPQGGFNGY